MTNKKGKNSAEKNKLYTAICKYGYYDNDDVFNGPISEELSTEANSIGEAVKNMKDELSVLVTDKNLEGKEHYSPIGIESISYQGETVYQKGWQRFEVKCVEEVLDEFDTFEHYKPLPTKTLYAALVKIVEQEANSELQKQVDKTRREGGFLATGTFTVRTEKIMNYKGETVIKNNLERLH